MPSGIVSQPARKQRLTRRLSERTFMDEGRSLPLSQLRLARNDPERSPATHRMQAMIVRRQVLVCHPDPPEDGEGPHKWNWTVVSNQEARIATARSLSALRRIGMTKKMMPSSCHSCS